jgi:hypothetical protein
MNAFENGLLGAGGSSQRDDRYLTCNCQRDAGGTLAR